jgi:hypothetical protein
VGDDHGRDHPGAVGVSCHALVRVSGHRRDERHDRQQISAKRIGHRAEADFGPMNSSAIRFR